MPEKKRLLTKSAYRAGLACDKLLWMYQNAREEMPEPDEGTQALFNQGHLVGKLATSLYPDGIEIDWSEGHEAGIAQTRAALPGRKPLFEAGFQYGRTHARADILTPSAGGRWDLIEVKSSGAVKEDHVHDVAFQKHVYNSAGVRIGRCFVMHVDKTYVRKGKLDVEKLFQRTDVTGEVRALLPEVPAEAKRMLGVMGKEKCPKVAVGPQCAECDLHDECWSFLPERSVFTLYRGGARSIDLMNQGILKNDDITDDLRLTEKQSIQVACERTEKPHVEAGKIAAFLGRLKYPLYFLDFETFMTAIPPYDLMSPYEQVPFQYSLHVIDSPGSRPRPFAYLSDAASDPRPEILAGLKAQLGRGGSIVAYNAGFEQRILESCARRFLEYGTWFESIRSRLVDLLIPFREFHYYHPDQAGSASLKAVLPALTGMSYEGLEIADGQTASRRFCDLAFGNLKDAEKEAIRKALEVYCHQDTEGMIEIITALKRICR